MICQHCKDRADVGDRVHEPYEDPGCVCQHGEPYVASPVGDFGPADGNWRHFNRGS